MEIRSERRGLPALIIGVAALLVLAFAACTGGGGEGETPGGLPLVPSGPPAGKAQLLVTSVDDGTVAMRSPTFRCAADYCAGAVILGLQEILGKDNFEWGTGVVPNADFVELRIRFDPAQYTVDDIVEATRQAMEKYRDPKYPSGVEVVYIEGEPQVLPIVISSERVVGRNRFVLGLLDPENNLILDAQVRFRFFRMTGGQPELGSEVEARPIIVAKSFVHEHETGVEERHEAGTTGAYVAYPEFDVPGRWQVEIIAVRGGRELAPVRTEFEVSEGGIGLQVGDKAPRSHQPTTDDVDDLSEIDSSFPLRPEMHTMTIAEAIESGRPTVMAFATPAFCVSRVCGPIMDAVVDPLFEKYRGRVNFIHVEPYRLKEARQGVGLFLTETMQEWKLQTEPWIFVLDRNGRIAAKFEGITSVGEVEEVLEKIVG